MPMHKGYFLNVGFLFQTTYQLSLIPYLEKCLIWSGLVPSLVLSATEVKFYSPGLIFCCIHLEAKKQKLNIQLPLGIGNFINMNLNLVAADQF
jgi:hypothetical protein